VLPVASLYCATYFKNSNKNGEKRGGARPIVTEDFYEQNALRVFEALGYEVLHGPDIAPDSDQPLRHAVEEGLKRLKQQEAIDLVAGNRQVYG